MTNHAVSSYITAEVLQHKTLYQYTYVCSIKNIFLKKLSCPTSIHTTINKVTSA